ncbi:MAG: ATP-binding protein [Eubacteriales bacterium]|nr:ATP-binding protein [Eubacteriales bacterium]
MKKRIFWSILLGSVCVLAIAVAAVLFAVYDGFADERRAQIRSEAGILAVYAGEGDLDALRQAGLASENRITLVSPDGEVLYDSFADEESLENHAARPEIEEALASGTGEATRASDTLGEMTYNYARRLSDGSVLRVAAAMRSVSRVFFGMFYVVVPILLLACALAALLAKLLSARIAGPIARIDPEHPLDCRAYDELSPLLLRMERKNNDAAVATTLLQKEQREFRDIVDEMREALVVFSADRRVIMANRAANALFEREDAHGLTELELCRDEAYQNVLEHAFGGEFAECRVAWDGRIYRLSASPVREGGKDAGDRAAVLLAMDVTDTARAEELRREFTANVSHELKTPLQSILGCAEILSGGIAKQEDFPRFLSQIDTEARRLLKLIEDILELSSLDEGIREKKAPVELYTLAKTVVQALGVKADAARVTVELTGEPVTVEGVSSTLYEMVYNLVDNAISYNVEDGRVDVTVGYRDGCPAVVVRDTGIGIAAADQSRIFERFYRVDKSHSKSTGGTGLGLSIVKHGAAMHGARVTLESAPGKGSEFAILFRSRERDAEKARG